MHEIKKVRDLWRLHTARKIAYVDCPTGVTSPKMGVLSVNELIEADAQQHKLSHGVLTFSAIIVAYRRTYISIGWCHVWRSKQSRRRAPHGHL